MKISISQAAALTGRNRATIRKYSANLHSEPGPGNALLFDSKSLLEAIYYGHNGSGEFISTPEAVRQLTIAKKQQIELDMQITREERIPREEHSRALVTLVALFRSSLLGRFGQVVDNSMLGACQKDLQEYVIAIAPESERTAIKKKFCEAELDSIAGHIQWLKRQVVKDRWRSDVDAAAERLGQAYSASLSDKSEAILEQLEQAQAAYRAILDSEPNRPEHLK